MKVLVCGGRKFTDKGLLDRTLDALDPQPSLIIQGEASGADTMAAQWAAARGIPIASYPAQWSLGRGAGPIRNRFMLQDSQPDLVVAFPGGNGTANMVKIAEKAGVRVIRVTTKG